MNKIRTLAILTTVIFFLSSCTSLFLPDKPESKKEKNTTTPPQTEELVVDMRKKKDVLNLIKRMDWQMPVDFDNRHEKDYAERMCDRKRQMFNNLGVFEKEIEVLIYGKDPHDPRNVLCLPNRITQQKANKYCQAVDEGRWRYYALREENHIFVCIKNQER